MRNGRLEKALRNRRARQPADQLSCVPCSMPPPTPRQSRKGSAVQDFDCCPVLHFALVCEKEMRFFPFSFIPTLTMFPSPKGSSHSCRPAGALSSFCPFVSTGCSRPASGKVFLAWSLSRFGTGGSRACGPNTGREQLQAPEVRTCQETTAATRLLETRKRCPNLQLHPKVAFSRKAAGQLPWPLAKHALAVDGGGSQLGYLQVNHIHKLISAGRSKGVPASRSPKDTPGFWSLTVSFERFRRMQVA